MHSTTIKIYNIFVLHAPPISSSLTWLFQLYLVTSTSHEDPRYAVSSTLPSPHPSSVQITSSAALNVRDQVSHPYWTTGKIIGTTELLERKSSGSGLESWEYGCMDPSRWQCDTLYPQKLALTSPTSGCCLVGIVCSLTQVKEFVFVL
jgi:hypothetical protein